MTGISMMPAAAASAPAWRGISVLLLLVAFMAAAPCRVSAQKYLRLGFIMPHTTGDDAIPPRLAREWNTAVQVALDVLGPQFESKFTVVPYRDHAACNQQDAADAAQRLVDAGVVAVVGPACSEAVVGAAPVLGMRGIPLISFAATSDLFREEERFYNVFRTSYGDRHQSAAMQSMIRSFGSTSLYIFYSNETYGRGLGFDIQSRAHDIGVSTEMVCIPYPPPPDLSRFFYSNGQLIAANDTTLTVFATLPRIAQNLWTAALNIDQNLLRYPYWYMGTDGSTAFDLVSEGDAQFSQLANLLQGTIGAAPYKGDYSEETSNFHSFLSYWFYKPYSEFPGLLTLPVNPRIRTTRAYVPYLIDAVWSFFLAFDNILTEQGADDVTPGAVMGCLKSGSVSFKGASGNVGYNETSGERRKDVATPQFSLVNLVNVTWEEKADWIEQTASKFFINTSHLIDRPGPLPSGSSRWGVAASYSLPNTYNDPQEINPDIISEPPAPPTETSSSGGGGGLSTVAIVAIVLMSIMVAIAIAVGVFVLYRRRKSSMDYERQEFVTNTGFVRMI